MLALIRFYQCTFSTVMGKQCRYHPSCSNYTAGAIRKFGAGKGGWLGLLRILRCHPWRAGGHDPVPDKFCYLPATCDKTQPD
ncbi:MAG TPA: membrane protein insertion efficiency factor YidD [Patescibacteria group bacterium]|nr:membrane protein insertion efficiency factor YidD [Patescibacteria group bacterium]